MKTLYRALRTHTSRSTVCVFHSSSTTTKLGGSGSRLRAWGNCNSHQERHLALVLCCFDECCVFASNHLRFMSFHLCSGWWSLSRELVLASHGIPSFAVALDIPTGQFCRCQNSIRQTRQTDKSKDNIYCKYQVNGEKSTCSCSSSSQHLAVRFSVPKKKLLRAPWKKSFAERWHRSSSKMPRDSGRKSQCHPMFSHRKQMDLKACALCWDTSRCIPHSWFMQRTKMIARFKTHLTHLAVNCDSLSLSCCCHLGACHTEECRWFAFGS